MSIRRRPLLYMRLQAFLVLLALSGLASKAMASPYSFLVKVSGHGKPMILIPGLSCGTDEWTSTIEHFQGRYEIHAITLPGFAGQPPIPAPMLPRVRQEIQSYIRDLHLDHPVIIGHSLGGHMAMWIAATSPKLVSKVVSVDGPAFLPAILDPNATVKSVSKMAESIRDTLVKSDPIAFKQSTKRSLSSMITKPSDAAWILESSEKSDPRSVGEAIYELYSTDLRPLVGKIESPVLMLAAGAFVTSSDMEKQVLAVYEAEVKTIPKHKVVVSRKARHFIMLDDPEFYFRELDSFLNN